MNDGIKRFISYVQIDTQADDTSTLTPSTLKQLDLTRQLQKELKELGIEGTIDEFGRLYAKLPGDETLPTIGLNAHVDTALEITGKGVKPQIHENYDGGDIKLNDEYTLSPKDFPRLKDYVGDTLITTSGDTLLGADDKAGVAIIMSVIAYLVEHPEIKHHPIAILFTPDEEIGRGPEHFDAKKFGADWAYTIDGADPIEIEPENFNAAHADIVINGFSIHPGEAKGKLVNAASIACEFDTLLPKFDRPEYTEGYEGFNHLCEIKGTLEHTEMHYIIRNHNAEKLEKQKEDFRSTVEFLQKKYPHSEIQLTLENDYRNMREVFDKDSRAIDHADRCYKNLGITPRYNPIRGGTDGATFSFLGCPTPNLGTGSYNHHGRYEFVNVREFELMQKIVLELVKA